MDKIENELITYCLRPSDRQFTKLLELLTINGEIQSAHLQLIIEYLYSRIDNQIICVHLAYIFFISNRYTESFYLLEGKDISKNINALVLYNQVCCKSHKLDESLKAINAIHNLENDSSDLNFEILRHLNAFGLQTDTADLIKELINKVRNPDQLYLLIQGAATLMNGSLLASVIINNKEMFPYVRLRQRYIPFLRAVLMKSIANGINSIGKIDKLSDNLPLEDS